MVTSTESTPASTPVPLVAGLARPAAPAAASSSRPPLGPGAFRALAGGLTTIDAASASHYLAQAYQAVTGAAPSARTLDLLWAQWALETSRGQAMFGNNFGGIKAGARGPSAVLATSEGYGKHERRVLDRFRTYGTPEEGARDYVQLLQRRYPVAFAALEAGDVEGFAAGLHQGRYFTANPETYRHGLQALAAEHRAGPSSTPPASPFQQMALDGLRWALEKAREE